MSMSSQGGHCPKCDGAIAPEYVVRQAAKDGTHERRFIYCDFCSLGTEMTVWPDGEVVPQMFSRRNERLLGGFLQRLADARRASAPASRSSRSEPAAAPG